MADSVKTLTCSLCKKKMVADAKGNQYCKKCDRP